MKILTYFKLFRPASVLMMNLFIFLPILILTNNVAFSILQTLPFIFMLAGEVALNDCCDIEKDMINKPQRPLVAGHISVDNAMRLSLFVIAIGLLLGILAYRTSTERIISFLTVTIILSCYNMKIPFVPLLKTVFTAIATIITLSFVYTYNEICTDQYFFLGAAFFFILGRELLMDIRDINGDSNNNYKTFAVIFGAKRTGYIALICFILSMLAAIGMVVMSFSYLKSAVLLPICLSVMFFYKKFTHTSETKEQNKYILLLWLPIILMLFIQIF